VLILPSQDMVEPYIWRYLCFKSMGHAQHASRALVSAEQLRKVSCWTRKIDFRGKDHDTVVEVHLLDSVIIVLKHAVQLVELILPYPLVTHEILATVSAAASASLCSLLLWRIPWPDDTLSWIREFRNLRQLVMSPTYRYESPQRDSDWTALARTSALEFPELRELRFQQGTAGSGSPLLMSLLGCRFESLRRLSMIFSDVDPGMLATFFQHQSTFESCLIKVKPEALATALPHIACSYLTIFAAPPAHANTVLHPAVRILRLRNASRLGIRDESMFRLMDIIEAQRHADARLARVHIPIIRIHLPDEDAPHSIFPFRWHMDGPGAFTDRMRSYAARLSGRGIALVDCDGFTADGTLVEDDH
jgi:hypothetical protein